MLKNTNKIILLVLIFIFGYFFEHIANANTLPNFQKTEIGKQSSDPKHKHEIPEKSNETTTLATGLSNPNDIAVDDMSVYWTEYGGGTVKKVSKSGGTVTTLVSGLYSVSGLAVANNYIYFAENVGINAANIKKVSTNGGTVVTLASGQPSAWGIAVDNSNVYWTDGYGGTIRKVPINGGSVSTLATGSNSPSGIAVDSTAVYWSEFTNPGSVKKVSLSGGSVITLASNSNTPGIATDGINVYWTESVYINNGKVNKVPVNGGNITNLATGLSSPWDIAVDNSNAYWVENSSNGALKQVPISGGTITTLASGLSEPVAVAIDTTSVYWIERNGGSSGAGTVKSVAKGTGISCTYSLSSTSQTFDSNGGSSSVGVTASSGSCSWTATSNASWITITSGSNGTGNGTVYYSVSANTGTGTRTGTMTIAGQTFTVTQYWEECTYSLSSTSQTFNSNGGSSSVGVTASSSSCSWTATSNAGWITITSGSSGIGNGTVYYSVSANTSTNPRTGTMTIAGQIFTVTQDGTTTQTSWDFNTEGNTEGWTFTNVESYAVNGGYLYFDPDASDPYINSPSISNNASYYNAIRIRMASNAPDGIGDIYFITSSSPNWDEAKKVSFRVSNHSLSTIAPYSEYLVYMAGNSYWNGTITGIRIDPANNGVRGSNSDTIGIDYIRFEYVTRLTPTLDLYFTKNSSVSNTFTAGDTQQKWINVSGGGGYTVNTYVRVTPPDGVTKYAYYPLVGTCEVDPNAPLSFTSTKTPLYNCTWEVHNSTWNWNTYTFTGNEAVGTWKWEFWYEDITSPNTQIAYDSANYTVTSIPIDTVKPTGSVIINNNATYTNSVNVTLSLSATDNVGVTGYYISTSSSKPLPDTSGWTSVSSTTQYSANIPYTLTNANGTQTLYAWYKDAAKNVSDTSSDSITLDTIAPTVTITSPTPNDTYTTTSSTISLGGTASDSTSGVSTVTWSNNRGGSGNASGTVNWSISSITLSSGENIITVTAKDRAGNSGTDAIKVIYTAGNSPKVTTGEATNITSNSATLNGTVNANGLSTTAWFEYGTTSGLYSDKSSEQSVSGSTDKTVSIDISGLSSATTYYYRLVAKNNAGTTNGSEKMFKTEETLLEKYAPILYMHPEERYYPIDVDEMLDNSELWIKISGPDPDVVVWENKNNTLTTDLLMKYFDSEDYYLKLKDGWDSGKGEDYWKKEPIVYGRETFDRDTGGIKKKILQYWFFYIYNDWDDVHEGDWEMIQIILSDKNQPERITYSIHKGGETLAWNGVNIDGNHPPVYVTLGGHGSWNKAGDNIWYQIFGNDDSGVCVECVDKTKQSDEQLLPEGIPLSNSTQKHYKLKDVSKSFDSKNEYHWMYWEGTWGYPYRNLFKLQEPGPKSPPYIDYIKNQRCPVKYLRSK